MSAADPVRWRSRMGAPRTPIERALQWVWRWRVELWAVYIALGVTAALFVEFWGK